MKIIKKRDARTPILFTKIPTLIPYIMTNIKYTGANGKIVKINIHAAIVKDYKILDNSLIIEFKRSSVTLASKKTLAKDLVTWTWSKNVNEILNFGEVMTFLKSLPLCDKPKNNSIDNNIQQSLF
jgi:hypothetical protein